MNEYTLTEEETKAWDNEDAQELDELRASLKARFTGTDTEVYHPEGFLIQNY